MNSFWLLSLKNLGRNIKRNIATGSAIAFGFAGTLYLGGYAFRTDNYLRVYTIFVAHTGHLAIFKKDGLSRYNTRPNQYSIDKQSQYQIEGVLQGLSQIDFYERKLTGMGLIGNGCKSFPFVASGIEVAVDQKVRSHGELLKWMPDLKFFIHGKGLWNYPEVQNPIGLSQGLAKALGKTKIHDEVGKEVAPIMPCDSSEVVDSFAKDANVQLLSGTWSGSMGVLDGEVVNHFTTGFDEGDNSAILISTDYLQKLFDTENIGQYAVWLKEPGDLDEVYNLLKKNFAELKLPLDVYKWNNEKLSPYYYGTVDFLDYLINFIGTVLIVVIGFSILNSVTMTVLERSQEIGMYRSIGLRKNHIQKIFLMESFWLSLISLLAGALIGGLSIFILNSAHIIYYPPGVAGGMSLLIVINLPFALKSALAIMLLSLLVTWWTVRERLEVNVAHLLGGLFR
jgi:putative ABC transport system permease protein